MREEYENAEETIRENIEERREAETPSAEGSHTETIGKVTLDYSKYPGEDFYCDGDVEDELLFIVKKYSPVEYQRIIEERENWPILYHLSNQRENIVEWIPFEGKKVLEVGSGCGAITGVLSRKAESVTCVDLSKKRSLINAYRHPDAENVTIHVGNFTDVEPDLPRDYEYIFLIGVLEYGQSYIPTETPFEDFLKIIKSHLAPGGHIVIAIENKYGLKYWAGCREDHLGTFFSGIENYADGGGVRTFTRKGLEKLFRTCDMEEYSFYYPYPDYKFMKTLFSDRRLPQKGELKDNLRNFDRDRMQLFRESDAFDGIIEEGEFPLFSNSYLAVIGEPLEQIYERYSNDRAPEYAIRTEICHVKVPGEDYGEKPAKSVPEEGEAVPTITISRRPIDAYLVKKHPLSEDARLHVASMAEAYAQLSDRYLGGRLLINQCEMDGEDALFEYIEGRTLEELMDACLESGNSDGFTQLFDEYLDRISYREEFPVADFDLVFSNILVNGDEWTLIDYEWTFGKPISTVSVAFRAVYCYLLENERRNKLNLEYIFERLQITEKEAEELRKEEMDFQKFVTGKHKSLGEIRESIGNPIYDPKEFFSQMAVHGNKLQVQIYEDRGDGFREEDSYFLPDAFVGRNQITIELHVDGNTRNLRIDPAFCSCLIRIEDCSWNGSFLPLQDKYMHASGNRLENGNLPVFVFGNDDPNISLDIMAMQTSGIEVHGDNILTMEMEFTELPGETAKAVEVATNKKRGLFRSR